MPRSKSLVRLAPTAPGFHPATRGTHAHFLSGTNRNRLLGYKEQELLEWHIQKKHQQKDMAPWSTASVAIPGPEARPQTGIAGSQQGGILHVLVEQPPAGQRSLSHTSQKVIIQGHCHTPPRSPTMRSPGPGSWTPVPLTKDAPLPTVLIRKVESRSSIRVSTEGQGSGVTPKGESQGMAGILNLLGQSKNSTLREPGRPRSPKEKEEDGQSSAKRPEILREDQSTMGKAGSAKAQEVEVEISMMMDQKMHRLSWADSMPEAQRASRTQQQPGTARLSFLDPAFMCQNQLELPCMATALASPPQHPLPGAPKPSCLAHTIVESLDPEQAMRDLNMHLAKGLEKGRSQPSVEYPICLLCGRCTAYCPHPRPRHSPSLLVYPRLGVKDGEVHMTLGFLLKMKRAEADDWGLAHGREVPKAAWRGREQPAKGNRGRRTTPRRKSQAHPARSQSKSPERRPPVSRQPSPAGGVQRPSGRGAAPQGIVTTTATSAKPFKTQLQLQPVKQAPPTAKGAHPKSLEKPSLLKRFLLAIKNACARLRGKSKEHPTKPSSVLASSKAGPRPLTRGSSVALPKPGSPLAPGAKAKGGIVHSGQARTRGGVPANLAASGTSKKPTASTGQLGAKRSQMGPSKEAPSRAHKRVSVRSAEPEASRASRNRDDRSRTSASPRTSKKQPKRSREPSPSQLRKTSSRQSTHKGARH